LKNEPKSTTSVSAVRHMILRLCTMRHVEIWLRNLSEQLRAMNGWDCESKLRRDRMEGPEGIARILYWDLRCTTVSQPAFLGIFSRNLHRVSKTSHLWLL